MTANESNLRESINMSPETRRAEEKVARSTDEFEKAMDHLEDVVEGASQRVMRIITNVQDKVEEANKKVSHTIRTAQDTIQKPKEFYDQVSGKMRKYLQKGRTAMSDKFNQTNRMGRSAYALSRSVYRKSMQTAQGGIQYMKDHPGLASSFFSTILLAGVLGYTFGKKSKEEMGSAQREESYPFGRERMPGVRAIPRNELGDIELNKNLRIA